MSKTAGPKSTLTAEAVRQTARELRADLIGIANVERFDSGPADRHPRVIFPECRSVIVLGRRILRGSLRGIEEGTNFYSTYNLFGFAWLEDNFLSRLTYETTCWIETQGFEAVPLFGYAPDGMPKGVPVAEGKPAPNVYLDLEFAAQAAGLGQTGLGGFFLTPPYGTRQRMAMILTDAALEPDPLVAISACAECGACAKACPFGAIHADRTTPTGVKGAETAVAEIDYAICRACPNGAMMGHGRGSRPDRIAAACGRACLNRLEKAGLCGNRFENAFRKRTPWAVDMLQKPVKPGARS